jgi:hypothetical protein
MAGGIYEGNHAFISAIMNAMMESLADLMKK